MAAAIRAWWSPEGWPALAFVLAWPTLALPLAVRPLAYAALGLVSLIGLASAFLARARRFPGEASGWRWFGASTALYALIYLGYLLHGLTGDSRWPGPLELLVVPITVCQLIGALRLTGGRPSQLSTPLDGLVFALAVFCGQWMAGVARLTHLSSLSTPARVLATLPFAGLALVMGVLVYQASRRASGYRGALGWMLLAIAGGAANNLAALALSLRGDYFIGHWVDVLGLGALVLGVRAARAPRAIADEPARPGDQGVNALVPSLPVLAILVLLLGQPDDVPWLVYPLLAIVLIRQYLTLVAIRRLADTLESQIAARTRALERAREELLREQRLEALGRLAGGVAYDFNNLLTGIGGHAHLIARQEPAPSPRNELAEEIKRAVARGAALTRQILTFARRHAGEARVVEPAALVEGLRPLLASLAGEGIDLRVVVRSTSRVRIDPGQLEQVVTNLVVNARDAMNGRGRIVITVGALVERRLVTIAVADTGAGMSEETRARLFEPFFTTKGPGQGTGLGLATCHGIVGQAGGFFTVDSAPGQGSTFTVHLPRSDEELAAAPEPVAARPAARSARVLLVDPAPLLRAALAQALRDDGFQVVTAADRDEALASARLGPIDVLVSEAALPELGVRTILMAGAADGDAPRAAALLAKPFLPDELMRTIGEVLARP